MTPEERNLISGLFDRLRNVNPGQKDQEAAQLIQQSTAAQPDSPYLLVQTLLVQEHALNNAQVRIQQLEKQVAQAAQPPTQQAGGGGFLSGLFGHHADPAPAQQPAQPPQGNIPPQQLPQNPAYTQSAPPYPSTVGMAPSAGGGFLRSALTTAAGVAGGAVLFQGIENLLGHNSGPFGGGLGGGGFFGGGGGGFGGFGGGREIVENHETVNNYIDERGNGGDQSGNSSFLGGATGFQQLNTEDNRHDTANSGFNDSGFNTSNPFDNASSPFGASTADNQTDNTPPTDDIPPTDDVADNSMDNTYDSDNSDAGGGDSGGSDDSSYA